MFLILLILYREFVIFVMVLKFDFVLVDYPFELVELVEQAY